MAPDSEMSSSPPEASGRYRVVLLIFLLYVFFLSIEAMGSGFKGLGKGFSEGLLRLTSNQFVGLFLGILATSLIQSSSTTTSMVVAMVAAGVLDVRSAIPIVMGANIGTSVTNTLVSLGHITRRAEFERAFAAAVVHDFFNCIAVVILLPLEMLTGFLEKSATFMGTLLAGGPTLKFSSPLKAVTKPIVTGFRDLIQGIVGSEVAGSLLMIGIALVVLVAALAGIVAIMRRVMRHKIATALNRVLGRSAVLSIMIGLVCTAVVQSSSVTTSLLVPLAGAGIVRLSAIFPVTLGANVGTTVTAMLAAMGTLGAGKEPTGLIIALCHFMFNVAGIAIVYGIPALRRIPLRLAEKMGELSARSRHYAFVYVAVVFFLVPISLIAATNFKGILRMLGL